jgi:hypothetical protein
MNARRRAGGPGQYSTDDGQGRGGLGGTGLGYALMILAQVLRFAGKEDEAITGIN